MHGRALLFVAVSVVSWATSAGAVSSAELYTDQAYQYGRFAARIQFAPESGVVSSFFLWKDGSEVEGTFWNELDFEKLEGECRLETNAIYGDPEMIAPDRVASQDDLCGEYHTYVYEWTPDYVAWFVDDVEVRRDTGEIATAFSQNAPEGMQLRFNVWPGDATFGGEFDPSVLPVYQYIDWVEYSSYNNGAFELQWREDFSDDTLPSGWSLGSWDSPKGLSTHDASNFGIKNGIAVLALTPDDALGIEGATVPAAASGAPSATDTTAANPALPPTGDTANEAPGVGAETPAPDETGATPPGVSDDASELAQQSESADAAGCSCRVAGSPPAGSAWGLAVGAMLAYCLRRQRCAKPKQTART